MKSDIDATTIYGAWYYVYGKGSHMNIFGKILLGVPLFPFFCGFVLTWHALDFLFTKKVSNEKA